MGSCVSAEAVAQAQAPVIPIAGRPWHEANYSGRTSVGALGVRGNGALLLTKGTLEFTMLLPRQRTVVQLRDVTDISEEQWFLGKSVGGRKCIVVHFNAPEKGTGNNSSSNNSSSVVSDSIGFYVLSCGNAAFVAALRHAVSDARALQVNVPLHLHPQPLD
jgi:hypothetical protein